MPMAPARSSLPAPFSPAGPARAHRLPPISHPTFCSCPPDHNDGERGAEGEIAYGRDDPNEVEPQARKHGAQQGELNRGFMVGLDKVSPVLADGLDTYKQNGQAAHDWAKSVGISSRDPIWLMRTGRGGLTAVFYNPPDLELKRNIDGNGIPVDLLVNGYQVAPPSDTSSLPDGGGPYC